MPSTRSGEIAQLGGRISGRVSVGLITSVAQSIMARSSATVASRYPEITLSACEGYTETLVDWVNTGQLDFALINVPRRRTSLAAHHVMDEEMVLACRKEGPIKPPARLRFDRIADFDLVLPSKRHGLRLILDEHAAAVGIDLRPRLELDTLPALCDVLATTDFATVLPTIALRQSLSAGTIRAHRFGEQKIVRSIARFIIHEGRYPSLQGPCLTLSAMIWRRLRLRFGRSWGRLLAARANSFADELPSRLRSAEPTRKDDAP